MDRTVGALTYNEIRISNRSMELQDPTHVYTLNLSLKPLEITDVSLDQRFQSSRGEVVPQINWRGGSAVAEGISVGPSYGVVPSDPVGHRVGDLEVVRKGAGSDLVIVGWVAPPTESARLRIVEDRRVLKAGASIYEGGRQHS